MSTPQTTSDDQPSPENQEQAPQTKKPKRSLGFIESTDFQPSWLETGPLSPEMLAALREQTEAAIKTSEDKPAMISGGYTQRLEALERLYEEQEERQSAESESSTNQPEPDVELADTERLDETAEVLTAEETDNESTALPEVSATDSSTSKPEEDQEAEESDLVEAVAEPVTEEDASFYEFLEELSLAQQEPAVSAAADVESELPPQLEPAVETILTGTQTSDPAAVSATVPDQHAVFDGLARRLLIFGVLFSGLALLTLLFNPFQRIALGTATQARPVASPDISAPSTASGAWCLTGDVLGDGEAPMPMSDSGENGDVVSGDNIFAVEFAPQQTGRLEWQVVDCQNPALAYPPAGAWVQSVATDQPITFFFDSNQRNDPLFFAIPFVVTALDGSTDFRLVGSFQGWDPDDPSNRLERVGAGVYQQVRQIDRPGRYEAFAISGNLEQAIDAYGRTADPIPFAFEITEPDDYAVFLVDTNRGRASVLYGMPRLMTTMAYGNGYRAITAILGIIGLALLGWMLARMAIMGNQSRWLDAGCPQCGQHELIRVSRQSQDRLLHFLGLPTYRYQCRVCTWQGTKLSEGGSPVSPGATITVNDLPRQRYR